VALKDGCLVTERLAKVLEVANVLIDGAEGCPGGSAEIKVGEVGFLEAVPRA
jgi:hypothetical protein